jgi:DNA-binding MarR family transcriptional regulator
VQQENRWTVYDALARRSGVKLNPREMWFLFRLGERDHPVTEDELCRHTRADLPVLHELAERTISLDLIARDSSGRLDFTREGKALYSKLLVLRRDQLSSMLERWDPRQHPEMRDMLARLARHLSTTPPALPRP